MFQLWFSAHAARSHKRDSVYVTLVIHRTSLSQVFSCCVKMKAQCRECLTLHRVVQRNSCMFEFSLHWPRQPMHSPSAVMEHVSPNSVGNFFCSTLKYDRIENWRLQRGSCEKKKKAGISINFCPYSLDDAGEQRKRSKLHTATEKFRNFSSRSCSDLALHTLAILLLCKADRG